MQKFVTAWFCALVCAGVILLLPGCDVVEEPGEEVILDRAVTFRFEVDAGAIGDGQVEVISTGTADLSGNLSGFTPDEVVSAMVEGVELERVQPPGTNLNEIISNPRLYLVADGLSETLIAQAGEMPASVRTQLEVSQNQLAAFIRKPVFRSELQFDAVQASSESMSFLVRVQFQVLVEGL